MVPILEHSEIKRRELNQNTTLQEMREGNVLMILALLLIVGIVLITASAQFLEQFDGALIGIALYFLIGIVWAVRHAKYLPGWMLVIGITAIILFVVLSTKMSPMLCLLAFPVGIAILVINVSSGILTAVFFTLLILFPLITPVSDPGLRIITLFEIWSTVFLVWLTKRPLVTALEWSWSSYEQSRDLLEQSRDYQLELNQTLDDLAEANIQLKRLNRLAQGLRQAADDARHEKEQFVARVSHELRTPLNMIIGFSEMVLKSPGVYGRKLPPALLADLTVIFRNSQHLSDMIDDVLDLSQIGTGQIALSKERVILKEIIQAAAVAVQPLYTSKGLYLEIEVPEESTLFCDRTRIREVVINLLSNAGRFTDQGGVKVRAWQEGNDFIVSVSDTGPGISPDAQQRIFIPFQQADQSIRRRYGGTGLGLSISQSFVELHGGKMWVESQVGIGSTFYFTLPIDPPVVLRDDITRWFSPYFHFEEKLHRPSIPVKQIRPRFVVVDQGGTIPHLLARYMEEIEVALADSMEAAAQLISQTPVQALLINAFSINDTLAQIKITDIPFGTPVLVCTMPGASDAASALGVLNYLVKPISREVLIHTLRSLAVPVTTVLIIDDEPDALQLFRRMIISEDPECRVITASNGEQALQILQNEHPNVILLDLVMPEMDGYRLLKILAQNSELCTIPVVIISASDQPEQIAVTDTLAIACKGGFSTPQLLESIRVFSQLLGTPGQSGDLTAPAVQPG
jgi:signal transduction histidine kinase/CheY-like chemotaxis protein